MQCTFHSSILFLVYAEEHTVFKPSYTVHKVATFSTYPAFMILGVIYENVQHIGISGFHKKRVDFVIPIHSPQLKTSGYLRKSNKIVRYNI